MADLSADVTPNDLSTIRRDIRTLKDAVRFLRSSRDLVGRATIEAGKDFIVRGALTVIGVVSMRDTAGAELFRLGDMAIGRGLTVTRENGVTALQFQKLFEDTQQAISIHDRDGSSILSENTIGSGLGRPHLEHPFQPVAATTGSPVTCGPYGWERTHNTGTWTTLFVYDGKCQNGFLDLKFAALCSDGATAAEIQVIDDTTGTPLPGYLAPAWVGTVPAGTTSWLIIDPTPPQVLTPVFQGVGSQIRLGIQVRRTAGTGTITLSIPQAIGG